MKEAKSIDPEMTINSAVRTWPRTVSVFQLLGLDSCCGGSLPIREASERHGLEVDVVVEALEKRI